MTKLYDMKSFLDFAERKPPEEPYNYFDPCSCAMAQFLGVENYFDAVFSDTLGTGRMRQYENLAMSAPHTFGGLARRIRNSLSEPAV